MVHAWENVQNVFVMLIVVAVLPYWRFFIHCFPTSSLTLLWAIAWFLHPFYTFSSAHNVVIHGTFILSFLGFSVTILLQALWFWAGIFYPQAFFTTFWRIFVTQMQAGPPPPGSSSVPALTELSFPAVVWPWTTHIADTKPLCYRFRQWATK